MKKEELYALLDMETAEDFQYFENIAALFEAEEEIDGDLVYALLQDVEMDVFAELVEEYFSQMEEWIPDGELDFFTLITNIERAMIGMSRSIHDEQDESLTETKLQLADEVAKFRSWFCDVRTVECTNVDQNEREFLSVRDALALNREESFGGNSYRFDFQDAMDYELEEFVMKFADLVSIESE